MPFSVTVKARIFVRCARICCLCFKQTGTRIEAAHIIAEADGGSNDDENAIPLCFDCHEEIGSYNPRHPKGNKFSAEELIQHRDRLYALVEKGTIQAQIVAHRAAGLQAGLGSFSAIEVAASSSARSGAEARTVLENVLSSRVSGEGFPRKLSLLSNADRAYVIDELMRRLDERPAAEALMSLVTIEAQASDTLVLLERAVRQATLGGTTETSSYILRFAPVEGLQQIAEGLREAFFQDVVSVMERDQYKEVNLITPAVVRVQQAIPEQIRPAYVRALLGQAHSDAWEGRPAAQSALRNLPRELLASAFSEIDARLLWQRWNSDPIRRFLKQTEGEWPNNRKQLYRDYLSLKMFEFGGRHVPDEG